MTDEIASHILEADLTANEKGSIFLINGLTFKAPPNSRVYYDEASFFHLKDVSITNIEKDKFFIEAEQQLDTAAIKDRLLKDLDYEQNFLASVMKKLSNEKFVQNAKPEIIALERKKQADAEARINTIEESLKSL